MYIAGPHSVVQQILGKFLCHALSQRSDEHTFVLLSPLAYLLHQVVNLIFRGAHLYQRVKESRGAYHLLHDDTLCGLQFVVCRRSGDVDGLIEHLLELLEAQRTVVECSREAEAVLHEVLLAGAVAAVHRPYLRHGDVALVNEHEEVGREEVEETVGPLAGLTSVEIARVVLDAGAVAQFLYHLQVVLHALLDACRLEVLADGLEVVYLRHEVVLYHAHGGLLLLFGGDEEVGGVYLVLHESRRAFQRHGVQLLDGVYLVVPERHAQYRLAVCYGNVHRVALNAKFPSLHLRIVAHVLDVHEFAQEVIAVYLLALPDGDDATLHGARSSHAIYARYGRDDHDVSPARQQCGDCREAQTVYVLVDGEVFLDVRVRSGQV